MGKKIIMLNGSPRKKNTYKILLSIGEVLHREGMEYEIINLYDHDIKCCAGCDQNCIHNNLCLTSKKTNDSMTLLMQKVLESDGLIFASPVYLGGVTAKLKLFIDRTNGWVHNPAIAGKPILCVATTASTGLKDTKKFFANLVNSYAARQGGFIGRKIPHLQTPVSAKEMAKFVNLVNKDKSNYHPNAKEVIMFQVQKILANKFGGRNKEYWQEHHLLEQKYYYYDCKVNFMKKLLAKIMRKILNKAIQI